MSEERDRTPDEWWIDLVKRGFAEMCSPELLAFIEWEKLEAENEALRAERDWLRGELEKAEARYTQRGLDLLFSGAHTLYCKPGCILDGPHRVPIDCCVRCTACGHPMSSEEWDASHRLWWCSRCSAWSAKEVKR